MLTPAGELPDSERHGIVVLESSGGTQILLRWDDAQLNHVMRLPAPGRGSILHDGRWQRVFGFEPPIGIGRGARIYVHPLVDDGIDLGTIPYRTTEIRAICRLVGAE
ncbi:hypothetical protein [Cryobacterium sp. PH31-O1]|uniref:hypothetical protein n=1 Tax=Cryobacterium sp. PH31-O1 TaxID=3046306 RepID=UPI0024BA01CD|nr:hypothetical protein [Cryobacterium sp. PH31-O1]MDJ0338245.1 hypothetical protein [Cryobacterium sp. PH31-O1]